MTQDDKGNWKIEENLDQNAENNNKVTVCKNNQIKFVSNMYRVFILIVAKIFSHLIRTEEKLKLLPKQKILKMSYIWPKIIKKNPNTIYFVTNGD